MKFFTYLIVVLCTVTFIFSASVPALSTTKSETVLPEQPIFSAFKTTRAQFNKKCFDGRNMNEEIKKACISVQNENDINGICNNSNCASLLNEYIEKVNACPDVATLLRRYLINHKEYMEKGNALICQRNESNTSCGLKFLVGKMDYNNLFNITKENCSSEKCSSVTADYIKALAAEKNNEVLIDNDPEDVRNLEKIVSVKDYLNRVQCGVNSQGQDQTSIQGQSNDAKFHKIGTTLLVTIALFFIFFFKYLNIDI